MPLRFLPWRILMHCRIHLLRLAGCLFGAVVLMSSGCGSKGSKRINGGGSTFIDPIMQKWSTVYKDTKGFEIDYSKSGSGDGIKNMTAMTLDFGCSDAPMNKEQTEIAKAKGGDVVHIPMTIGAVAIVYNVPGLKSRLTLSGKVMFANGQMRLEPDPGANAKAIRIRDGLLRGK